MESREHAPLYNPAWYALNGPHSKYADRTELACAYKQEYYFIAALSENTERAYKQLASIIRPGRIVFLRRTGKTVDYPEWKHLASAKGHRMVLEDPIEIPDLQYEKMITQDVPEIIDLSKSSSHLLELSHQAIEIGDFYGIKAGGKVAAIAGERMQLDDYSEVSGVCTHPDYRRRGYGGGLSCFKCKQIQERGKTPFLNVSVENPNAFRYYRKLGLKIHETYTGDLLQRTDR